jgi:hypothetical protein
MALTYDHATCMHFPHPLNMTLSTCSQLVVPLYKYYFFTILQLLFNHSITNFPLHCNLEHHVALQSCQTIEFIEGESPLLK